MYIIAHFKHSVLQTTSSLYQPPGQLDQQRHLSMPNYLERPLEKNKSSFSAKVCYVIQEGDCQQGSGREDDNGHWCAPIEKGLLDM